MGPPATILNSDLGIFGSEIPVIVRIERMYWPVTASEVMKMNPGYYVSVIIPLSVSGDGQQIAKDNETVRFTRVKILRPRDILVLGRAYRLVTTQEVMKVLRAKKQAKLKKKQAE